MKRPAYLPPAIQFIFCLLLASHSAKGQIDSILSIAETNFPQEKVYLQTDKAVYASGETIWFKAYITADNATAPFSKTLYAELVSSGGNILQTRLMPITLAGAASEFTVPDSLADTHLFIRAYTQWMLNFDSSLLCVKPIYIIPAKAAAKKNPPQSYSIAFFPEGGDIIEGIECIIAFKAVNQEGVPTEVKGDIINNQNKKLTSFASVHDGMGTFALQALPGETYKAIWKDKAGKLHENILPAAKKQGVALHISYISGQLHYTLQRPVEASDDFKKFTIVGQTQQRMQYAAVINLSQKTAVTVPLATDSVPDGILQVTVFNAAMVPVAERLVFVNNNNYSFVTDLHMAEQNMAKRARSVLQIDVGGKLLSNLSVAITDAAMNPAGKNEEHIFSSLLLTSDLKGNVYNPAYYFSSDEDSVKQHLDLVMMANGWRRFKWEELLAGKWPTIKYQPDNYLSVQGKILGLSRTMLYNRQITAIVKPKTKQADYYTIPVNDKGEFFADGFFFFDTAKIHYQLTNDKDKTVTSTATFSFNSSFVKAPLLSKGQLASFYMPANADSGTITKAISLAASKRNEQSSLGKMQTLEEVKVIRQKKSIKEKLDEEYASGFFSGGNGYTFAMEEDPAASASFGILQYLQGKVPGLLINTTGGQSATWRGSNTSIFLNESPADLSMLQSINMSDVAMVKVFRPPFMGAIGGGSGGAIAVYTKKGSPLNSSFSALPSAYIAGYSSIREFYSPDYSAGNTAPLEKDYRTTLYWNPNVYFDKNSRRISIPFFNSDNCKKIRVIVEGINEMGQLTREEKVF